MAEAGTLGHLHGETHTAMKGRLLAGMRLCVLRPVSGVWLAGAWPRRGRGYAHALTPTNAENAPSQNSNRATHNAHVTPKAECKTSARDRWLKALLPLYTPASMAAPDPSSALTPSVEAHRPTSSLPTAAARVVICADCSLVDSGCHTAGAAF
ncbi:hypothetical protein WOLCODRAFT_148649 [Wolfiporia cocos MD-104 SS10]|uniref:Uncharacterized protein n=1 Tax=Wolfiporia cocos (strain MD-104) TaxID=742152 RepID=A0A2H3J621_WOLCO|nr:hypothetical protein WOLCODRAFT_148649 [Wolfiporia cocos MD-104 SS10]